MGERPLDSLRRRFLRIHPTNHSRVAQKHPDHCCAYGHRCRRTSSTLPAHLLSICHRHPSGRATRGHTSAFSPIKLARFASRPHPVVRERTTGIGGFTPPPPRRRQATFECCFAHRAVTRSVAGSELARDRFDVQAHEFVADRVFFGGVVRGETDVSREVPLAEVCSRLPEDCPAAERVAVFRRSAGQNRGARRMPRPHHVSHLRPLRRRQP